MPLTKHRQTIRPSSKGAFRLPMLGSVPSPYFQARDERKDTGRVTLTLNLSMKVIIESWSSYPGDQLYLTFKLLNGSTAVAETAVLTNVGGITTRDGLQAAGLAALDTWLANNSYNRSDGIVWPFIDDASILALVSGGVASYQTIVSQSGTSAPAVPGGFTPISSYPAGTTFTWARASAGVYTLTASAAVFSTSKTGVFIAPLQNLNASVRGVVTSSTVVTVTTAVQSVAILGLLGLTTTATDALLNGTMIYVQTYA